MLISHTHQFIFIHNYKVAGSSIRKALQAFSQQQPGTSVGDRLFGIHNKIFKKKHPQKDWVHVSARELRQRLPKSVYRDYFKFAFVRNPWDWQVSLYFYMLERKNHFQHKLIKSMSSFEEYIHWRVFNDKQLQKDFVTDEGGNLIVDFVGKYENLEQDFQVVCTRTGIDEKLPHLNQSSHRHYKKYYNKRTRDLVHKAFREDIEFFHYDF